MARLYYKHELRNQRKRMNYGKAVASLSEKRHEWNIEVFFYQGIVEAKEIGDRIAINPWFIDF